MVGKPSHSTRLPNDASATIDVGNAVASQLADLEGQLDQLRAQVRQAQQLASLGTASAMMAHEVSNLLTPIRCYVQSALDSDDPTLHKKALEVTMKNVRLLINMSERLLTISAAKPRDQQLVGVRGVVQDAIDSLCRDLDKDGIRLQLRVEESLKAWVDPLQLQQVLFNLFLNSRDAMAESHDGRLTVSAECRGDRVTIRVEDTGPGIPKDRLPYVFDSLQTSKPLHTKGPQRCAGLGLALSRDLVDENGGTITVESEEGVGTTFTITLPASEHAAG